MRTNPDYLFKFEPNKHYLALVDLSAAKSGDLMKNIDYVAPRMIERFQKEAKTGKYKVGDYIIIDRFVFFFVRKHYRTKFNLKEFAKVAANLPYCLSYKTTVENEQFKPYVEILLDIYDQFEIYETSDWDKRLIK